MTINVYVKYHARNAYPKPSMPHKLNETMYIDKYMTVSINSVMKNNFPFPLARITNAIHHETARKIMPMMPIDMNVSMMKNSSV